MTIQNRKVKRKSLQGAEKNNERQGRDNRMDNGMEQIEIKRFELITDDLVDLFKLLNADMNEHSPLRVTYGEDCFHDLGEMTDSFIAYSGANPVGCAILVGKSKEVGIITNIYVAPDYRRHRLCYRLFDAVEEQARERGHIMLISDTWNELLPMQKGFLNGGYTRYAVKPANEWEIGYYNAGHNYWKMLV